MNFGRVVTGAFSLFVLLHFSSCLKADHAITLPPMEGATLEQVSLGEDYTTQVYYDLENQRVVKESDYRSWSLGFESAPDGQHIFLNGGNAVFSYKTGSNDFSVTPPLPAANAWQMDDPSGRPTETAFGNWQDSNAVYLIKEGTSDYYKIQIISSTADAWTFRFGKRNDPTGTLATVYKDPAFSLVYFNLSTGAGVQPDATKESWDLVFTRYRYIYRDLNDLPYYVTGVLLNPTGVSATADSTTAFAAINSDQIATYSYTTDRDLIGFDWKVYDFNTGRYVVRSEKNYIIRTRNGQVWKMHFLDYYSSTGVKGTPSFEVERLE